LDNSSVLGYVGPINPDNTIKSKLEYAAIKKSFSKTEFKEDNSFNLTHFISSFQQQYDILHIAMHGIYDINKKSRVLQFEYVGVYIFISYKKRDLTEKMENNDDEIVSIMKDMRENILLDKIAFNGNVNLLNQNPNVPHLLFLLTENSSHEITLEKLKTILQSYEKKYSQYSFDLKKFYKNFNLDLSNDDEISQKLKEFYDRGEIYAKLITLPFCCSYMLAAYVLDYIPFKLCINPYCKILESNARLIAEVYQKFNQNSQIMPANFAFIISVNQIREELYTKRDSENKCEAHVPFSSQDPKDQNTNMSTLKKFSEFLHQTSDENVLLVHEAKPNEISSMLETQDFTIKDEINTIFQINDDYYSNVFPITLVQFNSADGKKKAQKIFNNEIKKQENNLELKIHEWKQHLKNDDNHNDDINEKLLQYIESSTENFAFYVVDVNENYLRSCQHKHFHCLLHDKLVLLIESKIFRRKISFD